ncbi:MAG: hypothetical protein AB7V42_08865 [Thermoleophilia bacterium]
MIDLDDLIREATEDDRAGGLPDERIAAAVARAGTRRRRRRVARIAGAAAAGTAVVAVGVTLSVLALTGPGPGTSGEGRVWTEADLLPWGDVYPFVNAVRERHGSETYELGPRYRDLPPHPAIRFPAGVSYSDAVRRMWRARNAGRAVPPGAEIVPPLPAGRVVLVADGRVTLDSAAPEGYDTLYGRVAGTAIGNAPPKGDLSLPRCQVLLGADDPVAPCPTAVRHPPRIVERSTGDWVDVPIAPTPVAPTEAELGPLTPSFAGAPPLPREEIPPFIVREADVDNTAPAEFRNCGLDLASVRLVASSAAGVRLYVADGVDRGHWVFVLVNGAPRSVSACGDLRATFLTRGAHLEYGGPPSHPHFIAGITADGYTSATVDGITVPIEHNAFVIDGAGRSGIVVTITGPAGTRRIRQP